MRVRRLVRALRDLVTTRGAAPEAGEPKKVHLGPFTFYRHDLGGFMERYVCAHAWGSIRVHHILRGDADPELHTHPFDFVSFIIHGGYVEEIPTKGARPHRGGSRRYRVLLAPTINTSFGEKAHRIFAVMPNTWTVVIGGPRLRKWGFWTRDGFVPWDQFESVKGYDIAAHQALTRSVYGGRT